MKRAYNPIRVCLDSIEDEAARETLKGKFSNLQVQKELAVEHFRKSEKSKREADIHKAQADMTLIDFLETASHHFPEVSREPIWFAYEKDGAVYLENPFNEKDMRNAVRIQRANLHNQITDMNEGNDDLYENGE